GPAEGGINLAATQAGLQGSGRYEWNPYKSIVGPTWGNFIDNAMKVANLWGPRNSPNTTTAEFQAARGAYQILAQFALPYLLGGMTPGIVGGVFGMGSGWLTTPGQRDTQIEAVTGMQRPKVPKQKTS